MYVNLPPKVRPKFRGGLLGKSVTTPWRLSRVSSFFLTPPLISEEFTSNQVQPIPGRSIGRNNPLFPLKKIYSLVRSYLDVGLVKEYTALRTFNKSPLYRPHNRERRWASFSDFIRRGTRGTSMKFILGKRHLLALPYNSISAILSLCM